MSKTLRKVKIGRKIYNIRESRTPEEFCSWCGSIAGKCNHLGGGGLDKDYEYEPRWQRERIETGAAARMLRDMKKAIGEV